MEKKFNAKQYVTLSVIFAAVFAIYNILVLLIFEDKNNIFWTSYGFMCGGFVSSIAIALFSFKSLDTEAVFMGIPLFSFSIFYFFAELFTSLVFMIFRDYASVKLTVAVQVILLLIFIIFAALALMARDTVEAVNNNVTTKVSAIKNLSIDVKLLEDACMDKELKNELHKIAEAIRYSDPMSNEVTADLDNVIQGKVSELKLNCGSNRRNEALQNCYQLSAYISERNQRLLQSK